MRKRKAGYKCTSRLMQACPWKKWEGFSKSYNKLLLYVGGDFCLASDKPCISFSAAGMADVEKHLFFVVAEYHSGSSYAAAAVI